MTKEETQLAQQLLAELDQEDAKMEKRWITTTVANVTSTIGSVGSMAKDLAYLGRLEVKALKYDRRRTLLTEGL